MRKYCDLCGIAVEHENLLVGTAHVIVNKGVVICVNCLAQLMIKAQEDQQERFEEYVRNIEPDKEW